MGQGMRIWFRFQDGYAGFADTSPLFMVKILLMLVRLGNFHLIPVHWLDPKCTTRRFLQCICERDSDAGNDPDAITVLLTMVAY